MVGTVHRCSHCGYTCVSGGITNEQAPSVCPKCGRPMSGGILDSVFNGIKNILKIK